MVTSGAYEGAVREDGFELISTKFANNFKITGSLSGDKSFVLTCSYKSPMDTARNLAIGFCGFMAFVALIRGNWILPIALATSVVIMLIIERVEKKNQLRKFMDRYLFALTLK